MAYNSIKLPGSVVHRGLSRMVCFTESGELLDPARHRQERIYTLTFSLSPEGRAYVQQAAPALKDVLLRNNDRRLSGGGSRYYSRGTEVLTAKQLIHAQGRHTLTLGKSEAVVRMSSVSAAGVLEVTFFASLFAAMEQPEVVASSVGDSFAPFAVSRHATAGAL
jgi:hypothetical protein